MDCQNVLLEAVVVIGMKDIGLAYGRLRKVCWSDTYSEYYCFLQVVLLYHLQFNLLAGAIWLWLSKFLICCNVTTHLVEVSHV